MACVEDTSGLVGELTPCPVFESWDEAQWAKLEAGDDHAVQQVAWAEQARCLVARTALLGSTLTTTDEPSSAEVQLFAIQAAELADHLLRFQEQTWLTCDCDEGCRVEPGAEDAFNPACALGADQGDIYRGIVAEVRAHSAYAAAATTSRDRRSHGEHVLQCLSAASPPVDWDRDGTVAPPALCANDFGLYGDSVGNLLESVIAGTADIVN